MIGRAWTAWITFWSATEHPRSLGVVRLLFGLVIFWDFMEIWRLDLVVPLFGAAEIGGLSDALSRSDPPWFYDVFPGTEASARGLHAVITLSALSFACGLFTRTSAVVLLLAWAQFSHILPASDRGIDPLCRVVLWHFCFAPAGATLSLDVLMSTGRFVDDRAVVAWPRRLILLQLVAMYFLAGVQKTGIHWYPMGHFAALYFILQDPAIARWDFTFVEHQPWFFLSQVGSASTILWQDSYPLVFLWLYYKATPDRPGRLRAFANRWRLDWIWIGAGAVFHLMLAASMELGIFPFAMLALYPAWIDPGQGETRS